jgi:hypothetical protein
VTVIGLNSRRDYRPDAGSLACQRVANARRRLNMTEAEFADALASILDWAVTAQHVTSWEAGRAAPLGDVLIAVDLIAPTDSGQDPMADDVAADPRVQRSHDEWRAVRHALNTNRLPLAKLAARTYPAGYRYGDTGMLTRPDWLPVAPVDLDAVTLTLDEQAADPELDGTEAATSHVRPLATLTHPYSRYTQAVQHLAKPALFQNRAAWRLLDVHWSDRGGAMAFGPTSYFAAVDVNEAIAHEVALVATDSSGQPASAPPRFADLPYRRLVGSPFALTRRPVMPAISTLTIRSGLQPSFLLHRRDSRSVAMAGGTLQVIPSGIFQPSAVHPAAVAADFSLWANIAREYAEELLGFDEYDGDGRRVDYTAEPFASMSAARACGDLRVWCLGVGLDALTLVGEILTVAVVNPAVFDDLAASFVEVNEEGTVVGERWPFTAAGVDELLGSGRLAPAGAGCVGLAWQHRDLLLA